MKEQKSLAALILMAQAIVLVFAGICTGLWYCFDDSLAELVGVPQLGQLPVGSVFAVFAFILFLRAKVGDSK